MKSALLAASLAGFVLLVAAAAGAHALFPDSSSLPPLQQEAAAGRIVQWNRAIDLGRDHVLAAILGAVLARRSRWALVAAAAFLAGTVLFSGVQLIRIASHAAGSAGDPAAELPIAWMGPLVPVGGLCLMAGWLMLALAALRPDQEIRAPDDPKAT